MSHYTFFCPHCGAQLNAPLGWVGQEGDCKKCGRAFVAPPPTAPTGDRPLGNEVSAPSPVAPEDALPGPEPAASPAAPEVLAPGPSALPLPPRGGRARRWALIAGGILLIAAIAGAWWLRPPFLSFLWGGRPVAGFAKVGLSEDRDRKTDVSEVSGGTELAVIETERNLLKVKAPSGQVGWVARCEICSAAEFARRKAKDQVPVGGAWAKAEDDGASQVVTLTGGLEVSIGMGGGNASMRVTGISEGYAVWTELEGKPVTIGPHTLKGNPRVLYLITGEKTSVEMPIWTKGM